ncbi:MAG: TIGR02680 family protein, partial [Lachnospiraceae bacterium]|nr:TIGR02680 family protein [Lachnospiraceae bacterium]
MNSRWRANKIGLVDFWYYDVEEFYFADGRMLLRGSNGSGKSVTMQSFIPLILDGNMRPERLDPFGSRARRMENYLLEENDVRDERTGYLYMEFKREESDTFLTIGIGMRARKNKKLEAWYFLITDGRRVGEGFPLYKEVGSRVVLTKRELKNRIGDGGALYDSQGEYMEAVNRAIFGFETMEEYKEMIDLLIQLRTPKLSKDFKPSVINEILSNSLQMLSEDDLRPMSEAIENMDGLKTNVEALKDSIDAAKKIGRVYDRYNNAMLYEKAKSYNAQIKAAKNQNDVIEENKAIITNLETEKENLNHQIENSKAEQERMQLEERSLQASDVVELQKRELELIQLQKDNQENEKKKQEQLQEKEDKWKEIDHRKKDEVNAAQKFQMDMDNQIDELEEPAEELDFDEFSFM